MKFEIEIDAEELETAFAAHAAPLSEELAMANRCLAAAEARCNGLDDALEAAETSHAQVAAQRDALRAALASAVGLASGLAARVEWTDGANSRDKFEIDSCLNELRKLYGL